MAMGVNIYFENQWKGPRCAFKSGCVLKDIFKTAIRFFSDSPQSNYLHKFDGELELIFAQEDFLDKTSYCQQFVS